MSDHKFALTGKIARTKNPNGGTSKTWVSSLHTNDRNANKEGRVTPVEIEIREMHRAVMRKKQGERNALMLSWVEETGARSMDLENLTLDHIPNSQILDQVREGLRPWTIKLMMKGEKPGVLRPGADLLQRTIDYRDGERAAVARRFPNGNSASLFLSVKTGDGLLRGSIGKIGKEAANDAGVVGVSIHRLRAVFGQRSFRAFSAAYEEEFKGIGPGGTVTASLLTLVAETLNHLSAQTLRPYMGRDFEARLRNAEAFKGFELDRDIEAKHRTIEMLEDRISHLRGFAKIVKTEANGDRAGTIHLLRLMLDSLMDELVS